MYRSTSGSITYSAMAALLTVLPGNQMSNSTPRDTFMPVSICLIKVMQLQNKSWSRKHTKLHFAFNNSKNVMKIIIQTHSDLGFFIKPLSMRKK